MMKKIFISMVMALFAVIATAQEYTPVVELVKQSGNNGDFTSVGRADSKKMVEENAIKSLFHTLFFDGVPGVNNGQPLVCKKNPAYTNEFFNSSARFTSYLISVEDIKKPKKTYGDKYEGTYSIQLRLVPLIRDVKMNTGCNEQVAEQHKVKRMTAPRPTIMVVPYKRGGESYKSILENDFDRRAAVSAVQKGFEEMGIKTVDLMGRIDAAARRNQYEENAGAADSNDKQLLISSGSDVYVIVDIKKDLSQNAARVSLIMKAYETASGTIWGTQDGWTNRYQTNATDLLCAAAVKVNLPPFLAQIEKNYSQPSRVVLQVALAGQATSTLKDMETSDGDLVVDFLQDWLDDNAHEGDYHMQGIVAESVIFDYVMIPRADAKGRKMTASKFFRSLKKDLKEQGIEVDYNIEGNNIMVTLCEGM